MKKLFVMLLSVIIVLTASAQKTYVAPHYYHPRTRVVVGVGGYYPYYPFYYDPFWGTPPYYGRPTKLEIRVQDIKADYRDRIWSARHDDKLSKTERKSEIHRLKAEREDAIRDAERNYHNAY
jgi:hypothetical protein